MNELGEGFLSGLILKIDDIEITGARCRPFFERLQGLYADMDRQYRRTAELYGFECRGCEDNCCLTRFYHHTYIEYLYLYEAYSCLNHEERTEIKARAREVRLKTIEAGGRDAAVRLMCPLNGNGLCRLYACRPMICRLHGVAYELNIPFRGSMRGPGCNLFERQAESMPYAGFDRTPFYNEMAGLERDFKQAFGLDRKIKKTITDMLAD